MAQSAVAARVSPLDDSATDAVARLRRMAASDPVAAQEETWALFRKLGYERDTDELKQLFGQGTAPRGLDGPTDGIPVVFTIQSILDWLVPGITKLWMPWLGKAFDAAKGRGTNRMNGSLFTWIMLKLIFPLYSQRNTPSGTVAFDMENVVQPGKIEPTVDVLKIDYAPMADNPWLIKHILDELVEIVPDTYLGRILWVHGDGRYTNIGYFALRQPAGNR